MLPSKTFLLDSPLLEVKRRKLTELRVLRAELEQRTRAAKAPRRPDSDRFATPGDLARQINPATVQTSALHLVDDAVVWAHTTRGARLIVCMPPQEGKSERVTKAGSLWALTRNPDTRIGIVSYSQPLAEGFGREVRNWISTNNGDEATFDIGLQIAADNGSAKRWQLAGYRGGIVCVGIGGGLTGKPLDALVIDDPIADETQAASAAYRDRVWRWWQAVGSTRLAPGAPVIVILTRWHEDDIAGRLLAAEDGHRWRVVNVPAQADYDPNKGESDPLGRAPGEWLSSARQRTEAEWEAIRIQAGTRVFTSLYQGRPSPEAGNVWKRPWWRRYTVPLWSQHPTVPDAYRISEYDELIMSWDMAFKDTAASDFVVGQVWVRRGADVFLIDQVRKRMSFTETLTAFKAMVRRWPQTGAKLVEDKANGTAVINTLKSKIPGIVAITPTESKYARANAVSPMVEAGNVFLPEAAIALFDPDELVEEAAGFPNAAHDDQVDATSQALSRLLLDGTGAQAWIEWVRRKAADATKDTATPAPKVEALPQPADDAFAEQSDDPVAARKLARDAAYRRQQHR
jgi:predicted phage terminase large subunit-like protein